MISMLIILFKYEDYRFFLVNFVYDVFIMVFWCLCFDGVGVVLVVEL